MRTPGELEVEGAVELADFELTGFTLRWLSPHCRRPLPPRLLADWLAD